MEKLSPAGKVGAHGRPCLLRGSKVARLGHPPSQSLGFRREPVQGYHATEHTWSASSPGPRRAGRLEASSLVLNLLILGGPWPFLGYDWGYVEFLSEHSFLSLLRSDSPVLLWAFGSGAPQAGEVPLSCPAAARLCVSRWTLGGRAGPRDGQVDPALSAGSGEPRNGIPALAPLLPLHFQRLIPCGRIGRHAF